MKLFRLIMLFLCPVFLFGCTVSPDSATDIMARLTSKDIFLPDAFTYVSGSLISEEGYLSDEELGYLYYDEHKAPEELSAIEDYCIRISKGYDIHEIHIIKTRHSSDNDMIARMLERRKVLLCAPRINPNNSEFLCDGAEECEVFSKGNFVFLVAGKDILPVIEAIENSV